MNRPPSYEDVDDALRRRMHMAMAAWIADVGSGNNPHPLLVAARELVDLYDKGGSIEDFHICMLKLRLAAGIIGRER